MTANDLIRINKSIGSDRAQGVWSTWNPRLERLDVYCDADERGLVVMIVEDGDARITFLDGSEYYADEIPHLMRYINAV